mmetsp:Transcript_1954/g.6772  ORF Transcript_1954/g.6772 Transcript_1954/m.6772 type:complete len:221 (-) Transcript_1954:775-1437(-)
MSPRYESPLSSHVRLSAAAERGSITSAPPSVCTMKARSTGRSSGSSRRAAAAASASRASASRGSRYLEDTLAKGSVVVHSSSVFQSPSRCFSSTCDATRPPTSAPSMRSTLLRYVPRGMSLTPLLSVRTKLPPVAARRAMAVSSTSSTACAAAGDPSSRRTTSSTSWGRGTCGTFWRRAASPPPRPASSCAYVNLRSSRSMAGTPASTRSSRYAWALPKS